MEDRIFVSTAAGVEMPKLIYGTAWKKERTEELVMKAVLAGFSGIDTACQPKHYEEAQVGTALQNLAKLGVERGALFLQTKFTPLSGQAPDRIPYDQDAPLETQVAQSFEVSQKNLQTDYVDSWLLHSPLSSYQETLKAWQAMETVQKAGGTRQLGISNCYDLDCLRRLYADATIKPAVVQNRFYRDTGYDTQLRQWSKKHGVIYQSFWTLTANPHILESETVRALARKYAKSAAQILFGYLGSIGIVPLTGTCSEQHMKEDLASFDIWLTTDELESMNALLR
ncbi:MAG: aldo/keto reductase family protein [Gammaproteobacteria bacterium]